MLDLILSFLGTAGVRVIFRAAAEASSSAQNSSIRKNALIYGAGDAGVTLLREIQKNPRLSYRVAGLPGRPAGKTRQAHFGCAGSGEWRGSEGVW